MSQSPALPDILGTRFDPQGDEIPLGAAIIAIVTQGERELGRTIYLLPRRVECGQIITYAGYRYKVIGEDLELNGCTYRIRVGARPHKCDEIEITGGNNTFRNCQFISVRPKEGR